MAVDVELGEVTPAIPAVAIVTPELGHVGDGLELGHDLDARCLFLR